MLPALFAVSTVSAQNESGPVSSVLGQHAFVPQHEFRLSAGAFPIVTSTNRYYGFYDYAYPYGYYSIRHGETWTSGAWTLSYEYRFRKWFSAGVAFTYYGEYGTTYSNLDNTLLSKNRVHRMGLMPEVRFTWLNRRWVRMYSSLAMGVSFGVTRGDVGYYGRRVSFAGHLAPLGITVGRSLFGFAELGGIGMNGALMLGIGYRFNDKNDNKQ